MAGSAENLLRQPLRSEGFCVTADSLSNPLGNRRRNILHSLETNPGAFGTIRLEKVAIFVEKRVEGVGTMIEENLERFGMTTARRLPRQPIKIDAPAHIGLEQELQRFRGITGYGNPKRYPMIAGRVRSVLNKQFDDFSVVALHRIEQGLFVVPMDVGTGVQSSTYSLIILRFHGAQQLFAFAPGGRFSGYRRHDESIWKTGVK